VALDAAMRNTTKSGKVQLAGILARITLCRRVQVMKTRCSGDIAEEKREAQWTVFTSRVALAITTIRIDRGCDERPWRRPQQKLRLVSAASCIPCCNVSPSLLVQA
jgi:hypothetical protein